MKYAKVPDIVILVLMVLLITAAAGYATIVFYHVVGGLLEDFIRYLGIQR